ncbi:hypothetical protein D5086_002487 [Populus alba]
MKRVEGRIPVLLSIVDDVIRPVLIHMISRALKPVIGATILEEWWYRRWRVDDYLLFLDDPSSKNKGFMDQKVQLGGYPVANGDRHLHRRRFSESDVCFGAQDGYKPCLNFARGFCKNGESCKFDHGGENIVEVNGGGVLVGSTREMEEHYLQQQEEMTIMKAAQQHQQQRLTYFKYMNSSLQPQNKTEWCVQDY